MKEQNKNRSYQERDWHKRLKNRTRIEVIRKETGTRDERTEQESKIQKRDWRKRLKDRTRIEYTVSVGALTVEQAVLLAPGDNHPPYSPGLAVSDFHLFGPMKKFLEGQCFGSDEEVKYVVRRWLYAKKTELYERGILNMVSRWGKCVERLGSNDEE
ncbi:hypothetical protein ANN_02747 [Periplaneta americana]|uniref:Uncharacterized protein n=1 Tax=Periplaneta americana TaxID=6978 RepID=A0ABQ8TX38_PERAM|nr:hypothetical protein ANN_02747 [Periplaneta americana]